MIPSFQQREGTPHTPIYMARTANTYRCITLGYKGLNLQLSPRGKALQKIPSFGIFSTGSNTDSFPACPLSTGSLVENFAIRAPLHPFPPKPSAAQALSGNRGEAKSGKVTPGPEPGFLVLPVQAAERKAAGRTTGG